MQVQEERAERDRIRWGVAAVVAALVVYAAWTRAAFMLADPYPLGIDGYYYVVQVRSLLETGQLNYPAAPLCFYWLAPFGALFGPIEGAKIGAAVGTALAVVPAYLLARRAAGGSRAAALVGATLVATSASSFYLATEFVKEGVGLTVALAHVAACAAALERPTRARVAAALLWLLAALLTHKSALALALLCDLPLLWPRLGRRSAYAAVAAAAVALALGLLMPGRFPGPRDLEVIGGLFTARADFSLPVLDRPRSDLLFDHEVAIAGALALAALALARRRLPAVAIGFIALALLAALPWLDVRDPQGGGFRLRLAAFVALAPLAALVAARLGALAARLSPPAADLWPPLLLGLGFGLVLARPIASAEGVVPTHPALVVATRALDGAVPAGSTMITNDRKIAFMVRWYARQPMRLRPPADLDPATSYRLIPLNLMKRELRGALDRLRRERPAGVAQARGLHPWDEHGLVLIPEATFEWLLGQVSPQTAAHYRAWPTT